MVSSANPFKTILRHRDLLIRTIASEVRQKYAGSVAGMFWLLLSPLLLMTLYSIIYILIFRVRPVLLTQTEYVLYIFSGLIPFLGFAEALNSGSSSLSLNKSILLNTVFPAELVPLRAVLASQATTLVGLALVIAGAIVLGKLSPMILLVPVVLLLQVMFVTGIVWLLALMSLVFRDIQQILTFVTMALLIVSPIAYTPDMVPAAVKLVIYVNPLSYFVIGFHHLIVFGQLPPPYITIATFVLGISSFSLGFWVFQRAKSVFFDYA